jgi:tRNA A-37 threonylcarbamoyl transferase component Bud32
MKAIPDQPAGWSSNKATFAIDGDRLVKRYARSGNAARDARLLGLIERAYPTATIGDWCYRALHVWSVDEAANALVMEHLPGESLQAAFDRTRRPELFVHAGRWIGLLHRATEDADGTVLVFNDYNRSNLMVDDGRREVIAIDPGAYDADRAAPATSIVVAAFSMSRATGLLRPALFWRAMSSFVEGYRQAAQRDTLPPLMPGLRYLFWRIRTGRSRTLISRPRFLRPVMGVVECAVLGLVIALGAHAGGKARL